MLVEGDVTYAGISVVAVLSAGIGAYIGAYLKKKGENLATHEDFQTVLTELRETTRVTKEIENKMSDDAWDRQKRWEMKREVLFEAAKRIAEAYDALSLLDTLTSLSNKEDGSKWDTQVAEAGERWLKASTALDETLILVAVVCEEKTIAAFELLGKLLKATAGTLAANEVDPLTQTKNILDLAISKTRQYIRMELGVSVLSMHQSNESLATPAPDSQAPATDKPAHH